MALAKDMMGGGFSAGQASAAGGNYKAVTATGSTAADAASLSASNCVVGSADGTKGVILTGQVGDSQWVFNNSASTLKVYPTTGSAICVTGTGLGTANAAHSLLTYKCALYKKVTTTQWFVVLT
jgi:hypothetical protein